MDQRFIVFITLAICLMKDCDAVCDSQLGLDVKLPKLLQLPDSSLSASTSKPYHDARYGRLNNKYSPDKRNFGSWCAEDSDKNSWLQIDLGKMMTVTAVATQASHTSSGWVESYTLRYSYDGINWHEHKLGDKGPILAGNSNGYDAVKSKVNPPITARYIRILPVTAHLKTCMRAELYGCIPGNDCETPVGISETLKKIPDKNMKASSSFFQHYAHEGRLNNTYKGDSGGKRNWGAWCAHKSDLDPYLQIDLGRVRVVSGVATQGYMYNLWTTEYRLNFSVDGITWKTYTEDGLVKSFTGNVDNKSIRRNTLKKRVSARYVRFNPTKWNGGSKNMPCLRVEVFECLPVKGSVPTINPTLSDKTVKRGSSFNLTCGVSGQPEAQVAWKRDGQPFSTTDIISTVSSTRNGVYYSSLEFKRVKMAQNGRVFSCAVWYLGTNVQALSSAAIIVLGSKPALTLKNITKTSVLFNLEVVGSVKDDIYAYKVQLYMIPLSGDSVKEKIIPYQNVMPLSQFTGLKPYSRYKISVAFVYLSKDEGTPTPSIVFRTKEDAPSGPPNNLQLVWSTENSVKIAWQPPDIDRRHGQITFYRILWREASLDGVSKPADTVLNTTQQFLVVKDLKPDTKYYASVSASTNVGAGPYTTPQVVYTLRARVTTAKPRDKSKSRVTEELENINKKPVDKDNAVVVTKRVENITSAAKDLKAVDVKLTADILEKVVQVNESSHKVGEAIVETVSNILDANSSVLEESRKDNNTGTRYVKILEKWLEKVETTNGDISKESRNVIVKKVRVTKKEVKKKITFTGKDGSSVEVPGEVIVPEKTENKDKDKNQTILFVSYKNAKFFRPVSKIRLLESCEAGFTTEAKEEYSAVVSSSIPGRTVKNLSDPIVLKFRRPGDKTNEKIVGIHCTYWEAKEHRWSTKGCKLHSIVNDTIVCHCDHMTNFAAMMDVYAHSSKACGDHGKVLSLVSAIGCFLSLFGLFLTMLTYSLFRRLRKELAAQVLIQLCFSLFVVMIVFLAGVERTDDRSICLTVAVFLHYFSLVAFMWMLMEAILMFQAFVLVWPPHEDNDIIKCSLAAWGIPGLIVSITLMLGLDNYGGKYYCRINALPFFVAFLGPVCLILLVNIVLFIMIMYKLSTRITRTVDRSDTNAALTRLKRAFGILILLGLTWTLGVLAISHARLIFQYLFAVCNSLQGFAIFIFYCVSQKNARDAWIAFIKCDMRSELKIRTESYYERRRLSSGGSKTNNGTLLTRTRTNSSSMAARQDSEPYQNTGVVLDEGAQMQTIVEIDISNDTGHHIAPGDFICDGHLGPYQSRASANISASSAEDELLKIKPQVPLEPYRSYRALSGARSYDVLEMADLSKRRHSSKSNEALIRKSMILGQSSPLVHPKQKVRPTKSCDHLVKGNTKGSAPLIDFDSLRKIDQAPDETKRPKPGRRKKSNSSSLTDLSTHSSDTLKAKRVSLFNSVEESLGTLVDQKPRSISTTAVMEHALLFREQGGQGNGRLGRSQDEIMKWLHDAESAEDVISSDESSDDYKSGVSRSQSDLSERTSSVSSASTCAKAERNRLKAEKDILDKLVVAPIRGVSMSDTDTLILSGEENAKAAGKVNVNYTDSIEQSDPNSSTLYDSSDSEKNSIVLSDEGYSASGEDMLESGKVQAAGKRPRRRSRSRKGSSKKKGKFASYV